MSGNRGGRRPGAGRPRKWASEADRKRAERIDKRTAAKLLVEEQFEAAYQLLWDLAVQNPSGFDFWVWLRYFAKYPEERPIGVGPARARELFRQHPLSKLDEEAVVDAALSLSLLPKEDEALADWPPYADLTPLVEASAWKTPTFGQEFRDEIGPEIIDNRNVVSLEDTFYHVARGSYEYRRQKEGE